MQITRQQLIDWSACTGGLEWFDANYPSGEGEYVDVQLALRRDGHRYYSKWLLSIVINNIPDASVAECAFGDALIEKMADDAEHVTDDAARMSASGNDARMSASGNDARMSASGYAASMSASGYAASMSASGNAASMSASGYAARMSASGEKSVIAASGIGADFMVGKGGCAAIAYHDGSRVRFAVAYEGENVRAGIRYSVNEKGEFVEVQP